MKIRRILAAALATLMATAALAACAGDADTTTDTTAAPSTSTTAPPETEASGPALDAWGREIIDDGIPADLNFNGEEINILAREDSRFRWQIDFYSPEITGEMVRDAVYNRNARIEERLGVKFVVEEFPGSHSNFSGYADKITRAYQAGSHEYDMVGTYSLFGAEYALQGYFYNINNLDQYLDLDKVWWNQNFREELTVNDKLYFVVGDVNLTTLTRMFTLFVNQTELERRLPGVDLYSVINDGKWTLDYFTTLLADTYQDLNGNTRADDGDFFGLLSTAPSEAYDSFAASTDFKMIVRDSTDSFAINPDTEGLINRIDKISKVYHTNPETIFLANEAGIEDNIKRFANNQALFMLYTLDKAGEETLRNMTDPYGVLPLPKFDENQDIYRTIPQDAFNLISILGDVENPDMIAAVLELMCAESYKTVVPLYYEEALKYKYMPNEDSGKMIDYLRDGLTFDFATINTRSLQNAGQFMRNTLHNAGPDAASRVASSMAIQQKMFNKSLEKFVQKYADLGN